MQAAKVYLEVASVAKNLTIWIKSCTTDDIFNSPGGSRGLEAATPQQCTVIRVQVYKPAAEASLGRVSNSSDTVPAGDSRLMERSPQHTVLTLTLTWWEIKKWGVNKGKWGGDRKWAGRDKHGIFQAFSSTVYDTLWLFSECDRTKWNKDWSSFLNIVHSLITCMFTL